MIENEKKEIATTLSGIKRAAIMLLSLDKSEAANILKHIAPQQVQKIGVAMAELREVNKDSLDFVTNDFLTTLKDKTSIGVNTEDHIKDVINDAIGKDQAKNMLSNILKGSNSKGLDALKWMEPKMVADMLNFEHPQIQAVILSYLGAEQSAAVMMYFDDQEKLDLVYRISALENVCPKALEELNILMEKKITTKTGLGENKIDGIKTAANIMDKLDSFVEEKIMSTINDNNPELGQKIQDLMFVFENIINMDDMGIQILLREISTDKLILALKGSSEDIKEKIFKNMSKRASELLQDDLEAKGPVKVSEVESAQKEILLVARKLADSGQISLGGKGEEMIA